MMSVLGYARTFFIGSTFPPPKPTNWNEDIKTFHTLLADLSKHLDSDSPLQGTTEERMLQGPFSDAMTHVGQIAMLRRLAGSSVPSENFIKAAIQSDNVGPKQPDPVAPDFPE